MSINHASDKVTYVQILNPQNAGKSSDHTAKALAEDNCSEYSEDSEDSKTESDISNTIKTHKEVICGNKVTNLYKIIPNIIAGITMSLLSVSLFTMNNILIKKFSIVISDILLVRSIIQISFILPVIYYIGDSLLPRTYQDKCLTICQGITYKTCTKIIYKVC
jgi:hypothetical protein